MKNGKRPTKSQREELKKLGYNSAEWLICKDCPKCLEIVHRETRKVVRFEIGAKGVTA